jgi:hypothetical protein
MVPNPSIQLMRQIKSTLAARLLREQVCTVSDNQKKPTVLFQNSHLCSLYRVSIPCQNSPADQYTPWRKARQ